jgi:hypothetical protein
MLFVGYTSAPFVAYVHVALPAAARRSRDQLSRWSKNIPLETEIDMTTMKALPFARVTRMPLSELRKVDKAADGVTNLVRVLGDRERFKRPWWKLARPTRFYVGNKNTQIREPSVWPAVLERIRKAP